MENEKIRDLIANGYYFDAQEYIREGFDIFKKNAGGFILCFLLLILLIAVTELIPYGKEWIQSCLISLFTIGSYVVADKIRHGETPEINDYFKGFGNKLLPLIAIGLIVSRIGYSLAALYMYFSIGSTDSKTIANLLMNEPQKLVIPGLLFLGCQLFIICYSFAPLFVYFKNYNVWNAMESSRKIIARKYFAFLGFTVLLLLICILGLICLGIGLLIAMPIMDIATYAAFNSIVGTREYQKSVTDISDHLIGIQ